MLGASNICYVVVSSEDFLKVEDIHERNLEVDKKTKPKTPKPICIKENAECKKWSVKAKKCCPGLSCVKPKKGSKGYICSKGTTKPKTPKPTSNPTPVPSSKLTLPACIAEDAACKKWYSKGKKCCPGLSCVKPKKGYKGYICSKGMTNLKPTAAPTPATTATPSAYLTDEPTMWQLNSTSTPTLICGVMPDECGEGKEECCSGYTCLPVARGKRKGKGGKKVCVKVGTKPNMPKTPNPSKRKRQKCLKKDRSCQYKKGQCCEGLFCCNSWKCGKGVHGGKCVEKQPPTSKLAICRAEDTACRSTAQCCEGFVCCNKWDKCGEGMWGGKCIKK